MILKPRTNLTIQGRQQPLKNGQHDPNTTSSTMVVSSRPRGRVSLRSDHDLQSPVQPSSPVTPTTITSLEQQKPNYAGSDSSLRTKRSRIASISDRESLQKRRRLSKGATDGPTQVHIPLRGRNALQGANNASLSKETRKSYVPPPLISQDSSISNSPLNSPGARPTYDQFKRIEEKAQKVVKKHVQHEEKRILRSEHGSTRSKTELAQYFPNFDDMLSLEPADPSMYDHRRLRQQLTDIDELTTKTPIVLIDDTPNFQAPPLQPLSEYFKTNQPPYNSTILDLSQYASSTPTPTDPGDPLSDSIYLRAHQKAERHEKQMKNSDKERAQHEKYQLERLLEELRGPDWLKTLGISGITDTEKKRYEVKRKLFIRETQALIDKFKRWKEEEKRRKVERQQQLLEEEDDGGSSVVSKSKKRTSRNISRAASVAVTAPIDSSEIDALASQQLLEEAAASVQRPKLAKPVSVLGSAVPMSPPALTPVPPRPFTSFFEKRHIRDAAVSGRNRGRKTYAFGLEVPELEDEEFELPEYILTDDAIRANQRNRRRRMRSIDDGV